jgi:hypothetical protein
MENNIFLTIQGKKEIENKISELKKSSNQHLSPLIDVYEDILSKSIVITIEKEFFMLKNKIDYLKRKEDLSTNEAALKKARGGVLNEKKYSDSKPE